MCDYVFSACVYHICTIQCIIICSLLIYIASNFNVLAKDNSYQKYAKLWDGNAHFVHTGNEYEYEDTKLDRSSWDLLPPKRIQKNWTKGSSKISNS